MQDHPHPDSLTDEDLLNNMRSGCTECFALLFHRYCRPVFSVCYRILRNRPETEDVLQEVFLSIFQQQERFDPGRGSVRTWVLQFAYFKALLRRRYLNIRNFYHHQEIAEGRELRRVSPPQMMGLSAMEWARYLEAGVSALDSKQRKVIELVHFEGCTLQESSVVLKESLANTRNYYYRGLKALRTFLQTRAALETKKQPHVLESSDAYGFQS
jgi:RNA polymerase sigma-70 factor (ECF subfamily)